MRLCWVSDNPYFAFVGQSKVTREFLKRLQGEFEVSVIGFNEIKVADERKYPEELPYSVEVVGRTEQGVVLEEFFTALDKIRPDILILSHDAFLFSSLALVKQRYPNIKIIGYFTVDGDPLPPEYYSVFFSCDWIVSPTEYGKQEIERKFLHMPVSVVPYGVDKEVFNFTDDREQLKLEISEKSHKQRAFLDFGEKFIAFFCGHNQSKKNLLPMRDAWLEFSKDKKDVFFMMLVHSRISVRYGMRFVADHDRHLFQDLPSLVFYDSYLRESDLAKVMAASDCLMFPSMGEGFGLPIIEAMSCGTIPITTSYAGATDFANSDNSMLLHSNRLIASDFGIRRAIVDVDEIVAALQKLYEMYKDKNPILDQMRQAAIRTAEKYTWDNAAAHMKEAIKAVQERDRMTERFLAKRI